MEDKEAKNKIPCVVEEGVVFNRRDMVRILRDMGHVRYEDVVEGTVRRRGEGLITNVCSHPSASTIIVNRRLYINVNGFEFMRLTCLDDDESIVDLVDDQRTIRLYPQSDALQDRQTYITDTAILPGQGALERMLGFEPGDGAFEEDFDESDEV